MIPVAKLFSTQTTTRRCRAAFTLVEVLVVLFILLLLAAVALPNVKDMIANQLVARSARNITAYIDKARSRAIAEGRLTGILIERGTAPDNRDDLNGRSQSIRIRELSSVPPYTGDASDAVAVLKTITSGNQSVTVADFNPADNQLLTLSASMVADPNRSGDVDDLRAPIRNGDYIELPGGRIIPFIFIYRDLQAPNTTLVRIVFDLNDLRDTQGTSIGTERFPAGDKTFAAEGRPTKFKIHRRPVVSTSAPLALPRGIALDLNYSGIGVSGNEFAPTRLPANDPSQDPTDAAYEPNKGAKDIEIVFGADGSVVSVTTASNNVPTSPLGQIFLCLGDTDGIVPDNLFSQDKKTTANLLNLESTWIVINPPTGRTVTSPFSPVSRIPSTVITDPADVSLQPAIIESRLLANFSDTVDIE